MWYLSRLQLVQLDDVGKHAPRNEQCDRYTKAGHGHQQEIEHLVLALRTVLENERVTS